MSISELFAARIGLATYSTACLVGSAMFGGLGPVATGGGYIHISC